MQAFINFAQMNVTCNFLFSAEQMKLLKKWGTEDNQEMQMIPSLYCLNLQSKYHLKLRICKILSRSSMK